MAIGVIIKKNIAPSTIGLTIKFNSMPNLNHILLKTKRAPGRKSVSASVVTAKEIKVYEIVKDSLTKK